MSTESAVLTIPCPVEGCSATIPMRASIEHIDAQHAVLNFSSNAVRAHVLLTHGKDLRQ